MKNITKALARGSMATVAAGAMALTSATPAFARDRDDNGIDAGDVIAGAVILGGIAIAAGALGGNDDRYRDRYDDRRYGYDRYARGIGPRSAVERCVAAVENNARRYGYRYADVTQIRDVDDNRYGFRIRGNLVVEGQRGYRGAGYDRYDRYDQHDRYDRYDRRGYQRADQGRFDCRVDYRGRVRDIDYRGIRGLR